MGASIYELYDEHLRRAFSDLWTTWDRAKKFFFPTGLTKKYRTHQSRDEISPNKISRKVWMLAEAFTFTRSGTLDIP